MTFSHLRVRKQLTHEKPRSSMHQVTTLKSQGKKHGLSFPHPPPPPPLNILQDHTAGPGNMYTLPQKEDAEPVWNDSTTNLKSLSDRLQGDRQRVLSPQHILVRYLSDSLKCSDLQGEETPRNKEMKIEIWEEQFKFTWKREKNQSEMQWEKQAIIFIRSEERDILGITIGR